MPKNHIIFATRVHSSSCIIFLFSGQENKDDKKKQEQLETINQSTSFKAKKSLKQSAQAAFSYNWNSLFLAPNAVADVLAEKLGAEKHELLDAKSKSSLGVRMALGETQLVRETRDFLLQNGVNLKSFEVRMDWWFCKVEMLAVSNDELILNNF